MIATSLKKFNNFNLCYGSMRKGDVLVHENNDKYGVHIFFYGIRGDGYVYCPEMNEKVHPDTISRYIENISRFEYKTLEYHALSEDTIDYLMFIRKDNIEIQSVSDMWLNTGEQKIIPISKDETIICFEGKAELIHNSGSKILENLGSVTSSKSQHVTVKSLDNAKLVRVKCIR